MAANSVKRPGEAETEDCTNEEGGEDELVLPLDLHGRPRQEIATHGNKCNKTCKTCTTMHHNAYKMKNME